MFISITPHMLMVEAQRMQELMHDGAMTPDATWSKAHTLWASCHTHVGGATIEIKKKEKKKENFIIVFC